MNKGGHEAPFRRRIALVGVALAAVATAGCFSFKPNVQLETRWLKSMVFEGGAVRADYKSDVAGCWRATQAAAGRLGLRITDKKEQTLLAGEMQDGKSFKIELNPLASQWTEIRIIIGTFGDEKRSEKIHKTIYEDLSAGSKQ